MDYTLIMSFLSIVLIDVLLSGDNALIIALVCNDLPAKQKQMGILLGTAGAVVARLLMLFVAVYLMNVTGIKFFGGLFLLYIAWKLVHDAEEDGPEHSPKESLWSAVATITVADLMMSVDNVIAVAQASGGNYALTVAGILMSIPLMIFGATIISKIIEKFPTLIYAGALLLVYIGGHSMWEDVSKVYFGA
jgi:YjbE family integral membrane protein